MGKGKLVALLVTVLVVVGALWGTIFALKWSPQLGLDLQGGVSLTLLPAPGQGEIDTGVLDQTVAIIRQRIDALGVAEPEIARQGETVLVQLPGVTDEEEAIEVVGRTAQLQFRPVLNVLPPDVLPEGAQDPNALPSELQTLLPTDAATTLPTDAATDATGEPTDAATEAATDAATEAATDAATEAVTDAATEEATDGPTDEATDGPTGETPPRPTSTEASRSRASTDVSLGATDPPLPPPTGPALPPSPGATGQPTGPPLPTGEDVDCTEATESVPPPDDQIVLCVRAFEERTPENPEPQELPREQWSKAVLGPVAVSGDDVEDARAVVDQFGLNWSVDLELSDEGADSFEQITGELACAPSGSPQRQLAIVLDGIVESAPQMADTVVCNTGIAGGRASITTGGGESDAKQLALVLRTGALPIELEFATAQSVSPTLGRSSLTAGLLAGFIGLALVGLYMLFLYKGIGLATILELSVFGITVYGLIILLGNTIGFTLTLAGIAGVIISIGIAADSSIIYRERYRDELRLGRTIRTAADKAFQRAIKTNLTGNTVSFLAAAVLYFLAVGPVRGFAFTLGLSTLVDTLLFATFGRSLFGLIARTPALANSRFVGLRAGVNPSPGA